MTAKHPPSHAPMSSAWPRGHSPLERHAAMTPVKLHTRTSTRKQQGHLYHRESLCALGTPSRSREGLMCNQFEALPAFKKYMHADVTSSVSRLGGSNMCTAPELKRDVLHDWCWCCVHRRRWVHVHNNGRWSFVTCCSWRSTP